MESGKRLKELRKTLNLTQEEFSKKLNIGRSAVGHMENGALKISKRNAKDICIAFNVNEEWLLYGKGEMFNSIDENKELLDFVIRIISEKDDFIKNTFLTLARLDDSEWEVVEKIIRGFQKK